MRNRDYSLYEAPRHDSLPDMLEYNAKEAGDRIAIRQRKGRNETEEITYGKLYEDSRKAAAYIRKNFGTGKHIAIIGENSYEWLMVFFGIVCSGNIAVPTDKELPAGEIQDLLKSADVTVAFVSGAYGDLIEGMEDLFVMSFKQLRSIDPKEAGDYYPFKPEPDMTAVIFFTSGTTGKSKGVMLSHGNIISEVTLSGQVVDVEGKNAVALLPFNHAYGLVLAVLSMLNLQITVYIAKSLKSVQKDIRENKPDILMLVPLFIETFYKKIRSTIKEQGKEKKFQKGIRISRFLLKLGIDKRRRIFKEILESFGGNLRWIVSGGAPLDPFYIKEFRALGIGILDGYGITECSPGIAINRNYYYKDGSVGKILPGIGVRTNDGGEIEVRGSIVMKGYYQDKEANAEAFTEDGWFRTGDLGKIDEEGFVFLTGRAKNLIILSNGENISPEELEADFRLDEAVNEVLVYGDNNMLVVEIYPEEGYIGNEEYFQKLMLKVNEGRPLSKQIAKVKLREEEFIKNTTKKIVRGKNIPKK